MPNSLVSNLLGKSSLSIFNTTKGNAVLRTIKVKRVKVSFSSQIMRHMKEDGTSVVDARIMLPDFIEIDIICPDLNSVGQVLSVMSDRGSLYRITTKGLVFSDMSMVNETLQQTPENLSSHPIRLAFQQMIIEGNFRSVVSQPADASVIDRGISTIQNMTAAASDLFNAATNSIGKIITPL